jgi:hypothetical protein
MSSDQTRELREKLSQLKQELLDVPCWVSGTIIESSRKQGKTRKPFYYLSQSVNGKTKTTYIAARHLDIFKKAAAEGKRLKEILSEINRINILLLKSESNDAS